MHFGLVQGSATNLMNVEMECPVRSIIGDTGLGLTVPEEQLSHGRDSSNMSGHAIPAMLCGNQYAVLFDMGPTEDEFLHGG